MQSNLILTTAQAQAVYSAMGALNNVHMRACDLRFGSAIVTSDFNGTVRVIGTAVVDDERYVDQAAFAAAYGLDANAAPKLIAAAPELLAALEAEEEWRSREAAGALDPEWNYEMMVAAKRRAAIAKATA